MKKVVVVLLLLILLAVIMIGCESHSNSVKPIESESTIIIDSWF